MCTGPPNITNFLISTGSWGFLAGIHTVCDIGLSLYSKLLPSNMQV